MTRESNLIHEAQTQVRAAAAVPAHLPSPVVNAELDLDHEALLGPKLSTGGWEDVELQLLPPELTDKALVRFLANQVAPNNGGVLKANKLHQLFAGLVIEQVHALPVRLASEVNQVRSARPSRSDRERPYWFHPPAGNSRSSLCDQEGARPEP